MESPPAKESHLVESQEDINSSDRPELRKSSESKVAANVPKAENDNAEQESSSSQQTLGMFPDLSSLESRLDQHESDDLTVSGVPELPISTSEELEIRAEPLESHVGSINSRIELSELDNIESVVYDDNLFSFEARPAATSSGESTPSRKRPAGEFLPISAEIKRIGVEISEEHAKQLKNDVRRLSPVLVSLRERTLGEISLTSDSGLFDDDQTLRLEITEDSVNRDSTESSRHPDVAVGPLVQETVVKFVSEFQELPVHAKSENGATDTSGIRDPNDSSSIVTCRDENPSTRVESAESVRKSDDECLAQCSEQIADMEAPGSPSASTVCASSTPNAQRKLVIVLSRVDQEDEGGHKASNDEETSNKTAVRNDEVPVSSEKEPFSDTVLGCNALVNSDENIAVTNIVEGCSMSQKCSEEITNISEAKQLVEESGKKDSQTINSDSLVLVSDICLSSRYHDNDQLSRKSPKVILQRTLEDGPIQRITDTRIDQVEESSQRSNLDCIRRTLADSLIDNDSVDDDVTASNPLAINEEPLGAPSPDEVADIASDYRESLDTETETETGSDNSERISITSINLEDCAEPINDEPSASAGPESDSIVSDEVPTEVITRIEPERPEAFTEDSAESLALATGTRDEVRSDGSDSGLGSEIPGDPGPAPAPESDSETSFLDRIPDDILSDKDKVVNQLEAFIPDVGTSGTQQELHQQQQIPLPSFPSPPKSSLKRRLADCMEGEPSPKRLNTEDPMRKKRNIQFDAVTVYYFPRAQGFTCVPSQGGSTLGMCATHTHAERFSLTEHAAEQRRIHRARLAQLRTERAANCVTEAASSSEDPSDDTDEEPSDTEELDIDSYYFLQPVPTWQRRALLRAAGVRRIDGVEKDDCRDIRASREHCGCGCKGYCDPESCPCSRANVKCQVDRAGFPCGCSRDGCANSSGRIEFNPVRVRTHFIHTLMRLQLEKKQRDEDRTEHDLLANNPIARGPMREVIGLMNTPLGPMDHPSVITGDPVSCLNASGFTTLHYDNHEQASGSCQPSGIVHAGREDSLDLYAIRDDCYNADCDAETGQSSSRKLHPEFGQAFQTFPGQQPAVSFPQSAYQDYQGYQTLASTSRSQFQSPFQPGPPVNPAFSHYAYGQDAGVMQASCQSHPVVSAHHQSVYETTGFPQDDPAGNQQQYTNLNSVQPMNAVVQQMGKLEPFSELLAGRYSYYGDVEPQPIGGYHTSPVAKLESENKSPIVDQQTVEPAQDDSDENFGEIIKKSMVETVSA